MTVVRVKGFKIFKDRHGHERCYHRKTRIAIDLKKAPKGSPEFFAECARIVALTTTTADKPGTLGLLITAYRAHPAFTDLAPRTRSDYQNVFDYLKPIADTPLIKFDKPLIVRIRDKAAADKGRKFANDLKARFSGLFGWGSERGYLASNTAVGIKDIRRRKDAPDANRLWSDYERDAVLDACPAHIKPAIALMMFTGLGLQGRVDAAQELLQGERDSYAPLQDRRARILAMPCPARRDPSGGTGPSGDHTLRQLGRQAMDCQRLQSVLAQGSSEGGT
jgi:hypothetical protein